MFYDIEGEPNLDIDYLHGLLVAKADQEPQYSDFLADRPEDEGEAFSRFVEAVAEILAQRQSLLRDIGLRAHKLYAKAERLKILPRLRPEKTA